MVNKIILLLLLFRPLLSFSQDTTFACPMKNGKIIVLESRSNPGKLIEASLIEGKKGKVYSCSPGFVKDIDSTEDGLFNVYIVYKNYFFAYNHLRYLKVSKGQTINTGDWMGGVKKNEQLLLFYTKDRKDIDPKRVLRCRVVRRFVD